MNGCYMKNSSKKISGLIKSLIKFKKHFAIIILSMGVLTKPAHAFLSDDKARQGLIDLTNKTQSQYQKVFDQQSSQNQALLSLQQDLNRSQQQNQDLRGLIEQNTNLLEQRQAAWQKHIKQIDKIDQLEQNQKQLQAKLDELAQTINKLSVLVDGINNNPNNSINSNITDNNKNTNTDGNLSPSSNISQNESNTATDTLNTAEKVATNLTATPSGDVLSNIKMNNESLAENSKIDAAYRNAFEAMKNKQYKEAETIFKNILTQYPQNEKTPIAQYYLGNCYYLMKSYKLSSIELAKFIKANPKHAKVGDAYLAIASAQMADNQTAKARYTLEYIQKRFDGLEVATIAKERLDKLR
jgi:tol-pal system protein YbgF